MLSQQKFDELSAKFETLIRDYTATEERLKEVDPDLYRDIFKQRLAEELYPEEAINDPELQYMMNFSSNITYDEWAEEAEIHYELDDLSVDKLMNDIDEMYEFIFVNIDLININVILWQRAEEWNEENPTIEWFEKWADIYFEDTSKSIHTMDATLYDPDFESRVDEQLIDEGYNPEEIEDPSKIVQRIENIHLNISTLAFAERYFSDLEGKTIPSYFNERHEQQWFNDGILDYDIVLDYSKLPSSESDDYEDSEL